MKHSIHLLAALVLAILFGLLLGPPAQAQSLPSKCGAHASGKRADGTVWTGAAKRMWVGRDGYWHQCQPWVPDGGDPEMPEPKDVPCLGRDTYESWADGEAECSSLPPGAFTGVARLRYTKDGAVQLLRDEWGHHQGLIVYRCVRGVWKVEGSICQAAR